MSARRLNSVTHTSRPAAKNKGARMAWDILCDFNADHTPESMWYAYLGYWVWVMKFDNGEYDEVDGLIVADRVNNPHKYTCGRRSRYA